MASSGDDQVFASVRDEYMAPVLAEIRLSADEEAGGEDLRPVHVYRAFDDYFAARARRPRTLFGFLHDHIFLVMAVLLTIVFGAFGLYHPDDGDVAGFLDIAKICAGAVVGGAAGGSAALARRRAESPLGD
ncbi:MAG: hypothetical protein QOI38_901 [Sphingomonadales bacterium]|jgi:hypothetical protein|nr:hypothetical protein [Sphingomonadales bacterium]